MDSFETLEGGEAEEEEENVEPKKGYFYFLGWRCFRLFLAIFGAFSLSILVLVVAVCVGNLSIWNPISVHTQCKIVSSGVDLRCSKVCELGLLNYKAKHVFYPHEIKKFRCHYDYYWASVFEVKYADHSGQERLGSAEVPDEALPLNCRPSFGAAWLTKDKFKVNESYDCWYSLGISKVNIQHRGFLSCQAHDPSTFEMLRRYITLWLRILKSWFASWRSLDPWRLEVIAGIIAGFVTSLITIVMLTFLNKLASALHQTMAESTHAPFFVAACFGRACFFLAYFTFMGWLTLEYAKRIGLPEILGYGYSW